MYLRVNINWYGWTVENVSSNSGIGSREIIISTLG